jgi:N-acetyl-beta-hexosaminidase
MVLFKLINHNAKYFKAEISIKNFTDTAFNKSWILCFNLAREFKITSDNNAIMRKKHVGDYHELEFKYSLDIAESTSFFIEGNYPVKKFTDGIAGCFVVLNRGGKIIQLKSEIDLSAIKNQIENPYSKYEQQNSVISKEFNENVLIPQPTEYIKHKDKLNLSKKISIVDNSNTSNLKNCINFLCSEYSQVFPENLLFSFDRNSSQKINTTLFFEKIETVNKKNTAIEKESYILEIKQNLIIIKATDLKGFRYGFISLIQTISSQKEIQCCKITDSPRFEYRGALLDTARHFKTIQEVKSYLNLIALYKINNFHWHLTEDEAWRIEIKKYPNLTKVGGSRGYNLPIPPTFGSGVEPSEGFYTQEEIKDIINYAANLNITIIPEIDIPGHCRALIKSFETSNNNPLVDPDDKSKYSSAQHFNDNVLNPAIEFTYEVLDNIIKEISNLFPCEYIHLGCDEVPEGAWLKSPECIDLMKKEGLSDKKQIQNYFINKVIKILTKYDKKAAGWEEIIEGGEIPQESLIYSWKGIDAGIKAAKQSHPVIMAPAQFVYFDLAYNNDIDEPGAYWTGGNVDTHQAYIYEPCKELPENIAKNIKGVQGCLWSEQIKSQQILEYFTFPKLPAFAETAWTIQKHKDWNNFANRFGLFNCNLLDKLNVNYRISPPGIEVINNKVYMNKEFSSLKIKYTLDGKEPNIKSIDYKEPFIIPSGVNIIKAKTFNAENRASKTINFELAIIPI